jgi:hypothetical protein
MLTPDTPSNGDGNKTRYLSRPNEWRSYDPELFEFLAAQVAAGNRSVACVEAAGLLAPVTFHCDELSDSAIEREAYMAASRQHASR